MTKSTSSPTTVFLHPGQYFCGYAPGLIRTMLGTCVSVIIWHPKKWGAMCHFLIAISPHFGGFGPRHKDMRFGDDVLEVMFQDMSKEKIRCTECTFSVFGGAPSQLGLREIGKENFESAQALLQDRGIKKIQLFPATGPQFVLFDLETGHAWQKVERLGSL